MIVVVRDEHGMPKALSLANRILGAEHMRFSANKAHLYHDLLSIYTSLFIRPLEPAILSSSKP